MQKLWVSPIAIAIATTFASTAFAVDADPSNYTAALASLMPGDTLNLAAGTYTQELNVANLNGTASSPITIQGPSMGAATFVGDACCNVVEITNSSFVVIKNIVVDSMGIDGVFGVSAKGDTSNLVHDITIEGCTFQGQNGSQQTDAISTKTPTWNWIFRQNHIKGAGTGMYLGNSDGSDPFVAGIIEDNLIEDTIGYNIEIKFQDAWPTVQGMPTSPTSTIVRNNVFIKNDDPSPDGDRPNLLLGGLPASGPGSSNLYEIYGNFFFHNPRESLMQASGRVTIHDNVFVDASDKAIALQDQDLPLELAHVYNNTIYSAVHGIDFANAASEGDAVMMNLVFATTPVSGPIANESNEITDTVANAASYVKSPSLTLGQMDFYPLAGKCTGAAADESAFASETDYDKDFNGMSKGSFTYRGAYAGDGVNPGWQLGDGIKDEGSQGSGGTGATSTGATSTTSAGGATSNASGANAATNGAGGSKTTGASGGGSTSDDGGSTSSGCGCEVEGGRERSTMVALLAFSSLVVARRRRVSRGATSKRDR